VYYSADLLRGRSVERLTLALVAGLVGGGLWLSRDLGTVQLWLFGAGLVGLVGIASESFLDRTGAREGSWGFYSFTAWVVAILMVAPGLWLVQLMPGLLLQVSLGMAVTAGTLLRSLREAFNPESRFFHHGRFISSLILYLLAFVLFALIYQTKQRGLITSTSTSLIALLAGLELLRAGPDGRRMSRKLVGLAALGGLIIAEITWVLNYWPVGGLVGGALLLLSFYVVVGLLQCIRDGSLGRNALLEYGAVGAAGILAIMFAIP
jgi:hypothetical protein